MSLPLDENVEIGKCAACDGILMREGDLISHPRYLRPTCPPESVVAEGDRARLVLAFGQGRSQPGPENFVALTPEETAERLRDHQAKLAQIESDCSQSAANIIAHVSGGGWIVLDNDGRPAEEYLGDSRWRSFRNDPRVCLLDREGIAHPFHEWKYSYQRHGLTTGSTYCDGLFAHEAGSPYLDPPLDSLPDVLPAATTGTES